MIDGFIRDEAIKIFTHQFEHEFENIVYFSFILFYVINELCKWTTCIHIPRSITANI